jgi:SAM-dependent methyltransferase
MLEKEFIDELFNKYKNGRQELSTYSSYVSGSQYTLLFQKSRKYLKTAQNILDWGSGNGHYSLFLRRMQKTVKAYCFESTNIPELQNDDCYEATFGSTKDPIILPYESLTFDAVVSVGVLEHVRETGGNEIKSLCEINRLLKDNGIFICYHLPNYYSWIEYVVKKIKPSQYVHPYKYKRKDIIDMLVSTKFKIIEIKRYGILPRNIFGTKLIPEGFKNSPLLSDIYNSIDIILSLIFSFICQNFLIIAKKDLAADRCSET